MDIPDWICIGFTQTRSDGVDRLTDFDALVDWAEGSGVVSGEVVGALRKLGRTDPAEAARGYAVAVQLRDSIYEVLTAVVEGGTAEQEHLDLVNEWVQRAAAHRGIVEGERGYVWTWLEEDSAPVDQILWRVAQSAGELLTSEWVDRLGLCRGDRCMWLFVDKSRNRSRRWCDMGDCGNLAKVRAFRERAKAG